MSHDIDIQCKKGHVSLSTHFYPQMELSAYESDEDIEGAMVTLDRDQAVDLAGHLLDWANRA